MSAYLGRTMAGFTLLELVASMAIAAILVAIAVPSYRYVTNSNRIAAEVNGLVGDLQYARAEAVREGLPVTVCVSKDGASCASGDTAWHHGWIVFSDATGNGTVDAGDTVLRVQGAFTGTDTFDANNSLSALTFNREGIAFQATGTTITLHDATSNQAWTRCVLVTTSSTVVSLLSTIPYTAGQCT